MASRSSSEDCLFCLSPASRLFVRSRCFGVFRLAIGCSLVVAAPPTPPLVSRSFLRCRSVPRPLFFSSAASLLPACLALVGGSRRPLPPPLPLVCLVGLPLLGSPFAFGAFVFAARPLAAPWWLLPRPPLYLALFVAVARCPPPFFCLRCFALALLIGARRRFSPSASLPPVLLFFSFFSRWALCALSVFLCFPPGPGLLPGDCCPPPPLVSRGFRRCCPVPPPFFFLRCFSFALLLGSRRRSRRLLPPPPRPLFFFFLLLLGSLCALGASVFPAWSLAAPLWLLPPPLFCVSRILPLPLRAPFFFLLLCSCLPAWRLSAVLAVCCSAPPRCVVPRLAVLWAAVRRVVFVGVFVCVLAALLVAVACCAVSLVVPSDWVVCGVVCCFGLRCRVLCRAVRPWVRCCAALLRVVPPGVALLCAVLFCCAHLVPLLIVPCSLALPVALGPGAVRPCVLRCSPALCALCCLRFVVACWCVLLFAAVLCAELGWRAGRSVFTSPCAVLCCAVLVR